MTSGKKFKVRLCIMGNRAVAFEKNGLYHILTRAVEKKKIFADEADGFRFLFQMFVASIGKPAPNLQQQDVVNGVRLFLFQGQDLPEKLIVREHDPLIHVLSFSLVVDHYHLLLVQNADNGIPKYMQKLNTGFAKYFNLKNKRTDALFGSRYRSVVIKDDFQLDAVLRYINVTNPLDVFQPGWRESGLRDQKAALEFLNEYQFSSFADLFGKRKSRLLASPEVLENFLREDIIKKQGSYLDLMKGYLSQHKIISPFSFLE